MLLERLEEVNLVKMHSEVLLYPLYQLTKQVPVQLNFSGPWENVSLLYLLFLLNPNLTNQLGPQHYPCWGPSYPSPQPRYVIKFN